MLTRRIFLLKAFAEDALSEGISHHDLQEAVQRADGGLVDARLGSAVIKQRIARPGAGKRGGYRALLAHHSKNHTFFLYLFAKNDADNLSATDLIIIRNAAKNFRVRTDNELDLLVTKGEILEITVR